MPRPRRVPVGVATLLLVGAVALLLFADGADARGYRKSSQAQASRYLAPHNAARRAVGVPPLAWSAALELNARVYALLRARTGCALVHSHGAFGENLFYGSGSGRWAPETVVAAWVAKERAMYDHGSNTCSGARGACGHYTQVVWRGTTKVGCAMAPCPGGKGTIAVCKYNPPGNYVGMKPY
ncbi:pathogenesis-related protein PRB1-3-like [Lolium rigidum]|uniref:pathogenesis-related protein PRB1-3-like n=1 Tax=Lolium rigidum TaxID=89674 RepID=UPI001F5D32C7|nr:pathogenesis-related protein PRB1-3-like [Lolium rigidum]